MTDKTITDEQKRLIDERKKIDEAELKASRRQQDRVDPAGSNKAQNVGGAVGIGAGAAAGAAIGSIVPGVGTVVGAVVGGLVGAAGGGAAGAAIGMAIDHKAEEKYWRSNYVTRGYAKDMSYEDLGPAYAYGWETRARRTDAARFDDLDADLARDWSKARGASKLDWERARPAARDAWDRIDKSNRTDTDANLNRRP